MKLGVIFLLSIHSLILDIGGCDNHVKNKNNIQVDSTVVYKKVSELSVQKCLENLLQAIVRSNTKHYKQGRSFYGLHINKNKNYWYLEIFPDQWHGTKDTSYTAVIKMKEAVFLCSGDLDNNPLFSRVGSRVESVKLVSSKKPTEPMLIEPSLQGTLRICAGLPIYVEVYTAEPIQGYKMNVKKH